VVARGERQRERGGDDRVQPADPLTTVRATTISWLAWSYAAAP
jgi:hypothetical protein